MLRAGSMLTAGSLCVTAIEVGTERPYDLLDAMQQWPLSAANNEGRYQFG